MMGTIYLVTIEDEGLDIEGVATTYIKGLRILAKIRQHGRRRGWSYKAPEHNNKGGRVFVQFVDSGIGVSSRQIWRVTEEPLNERI